MPEMLHSRIVRGTNGCFPELAREWAACLADCPPEQGLFSHAWYAEWVRAYAARPPWTGETCVVIAANAAGVPRAILPLAARRGQGQRYLSLAGFYQPLRSFPCVPAAAEAAADTLARALFEEVRDWDVLRFGPVDDVAPERAALWRALATRSRQRVSIPRGRTVVNVLAPADGGAGGGAGGGGGEAHAKTAKRIAGYARRFAREPGASIEHVRRPDAAAAAALFEALGEVERRSWLARAGGDLRFADTHDRDFWMRVTDQCLTPGDHLDVWLARLHGRPIAFRVVLSAGAASYMIANQYAEDAAEFRLGWVLYLEHLRAAAERGTRFIDSAPGDIHYKGRLGGVEAEMRTDEFVFRPTPRGWALARLLSGLHRTKTRLDARPWSRRLAARLPRV